MSVSSDPRWRTSLAMRLSLAWAVLSTVAVGISGLVLHRANHRHLLETLRTGVERDVGAVRLKLETWAAAFRQDAGFCAGSPLLREFLAHAGTEDDLMWRGLLEEEFRAMLAGKPNYFQMRVLGIGGEEDGKELLRIDRVDDALLAMPREKLQLKSDRLYFQEAREVPIGEVYLSEINLNRDFGEISVPHIPTLRAAARVTASGRDALVIINADLRRLFGELEEMPGRNEELRLVGSDGGYLVHPQPGVTFPADLGGTVFFRDGFPEGGDEGTAIEGRREVALGGWPGRGITVLISLPRASWGAAIADSRRRTLVASLLAAVAGAAGGTLILMPLARRLRKLGQALRDYEAGSEAAGLPEAGPDEVGMVVARFRELAAKVRTDMGNLEEARREAEEATRVKEEFLAIMTHEIRTPMNAVVGLIRALEANQPAAHQGPLLSSLRAASSNLMALLNSALDYTKLKGGHIEFAEEDFDAAEVAREVGRAYAPTAMAKGLAFHLRVPDGSIPVRGDPVRLRQVLNNLLANAVKFTPSGSVSLALEVADARALRLRFTVTDTGPGIDASEREKIFAPFGQASAGGQRGEAGTGLGLSIARALIERQGGSLTLASVVGEGAAFAAELAFLPARAVREGPACVEARAARLPPALRGVRILCVEDVAFNRLVVETALAATGAELDFAGTGREALDRAMEQHYDVALLDLQLPDLRGEALAGLLREIQPGLPMLAVTAQASESVADTCRAAGMQGVVLKPFEPDVLLAEIERVAVPESETGKAMPTGAPVSPELERRFVELAAANLEAAAEDIERAFRQGDGSAELRRVRHRLATTVGRYRMEKTDAVLADLAAGLGSPESAREVLLGEAARLRGRRDPDAGGAETGGGLS